MLGWEKSELCCKVMNGTVYFTIPGCKLSTFFTTVLMRFDVFNGNLVLEFSKLIYQSSDFILELSQNMHFTRLQTVQPKQSVTVYDEGAKGVNNDIYNIQKVTVIFATLSGPKAIWRVFEDDMRGNEKM